MSFTHAEWQAKAAALSIETRAFIGGQYVAAASGKTFTKLNPATGAVLGEIAACDIEDVNRAVIAARAAFEAGHWARMAPKERKLRLMRFAELLLENRSELALLESLDTGKTIANAYGDDIPGAANCIRWFGELIDKVYDEVAPTAGSAVALIRREAIGVVGAVVPWNYPLLMTAWKIAPILAAGNSCVLKPAEQSPLTGIRIGQLAIEAGIPEVVLNVVPGMGETAGRAIGLHMDIDAVAFTGSTEVGKYFMTYSGQSNLKRVGLECGGKSPNIVLADCPNLDAAVEGSAWAIFYNAGETCSAGSRILVEEPIRDEFVEKLSAFANNLRVGDPLNPATQMGALVEDKHTDRVLSYIEIGKGEGATLAAGGARIQGNFVQPTVFADVKNEMRIAQEEIFGPVASVITIKDFDEGLRLGNDSIYGLGAGVWTSDLQTAFRASNELRAGVVWINSFDAGDITTPFGGFKQSGFGRDKSAHAFDKYTDLKTTWINLA
ncbi:aldehyde dehydrogenase [Pseudogemmobacter faecipullorum]|uniref:Aldehyde dehydrogenase n=1 Tax=Pseudogemmobacter faecipullorum TaxID=2755041 RepID=A0ABS8CMU6_9RHOB|nr:aldehyde dehydrogenase [Pseudogemmobacter faecipullorum]MCB5410718.1 aldehyde dehydrogenase [Pseudogemmobacter faecipullorum]